MEGLSLMPEEPLASDCCGSGCAVCVFDIYQRDLEKWKRQCKMITSDQPETATKPDDFMSKYEFRYFQLISIVSHTNDTAIYRFKIPTETLLNLKIGDHLILRSFSEGKCITRSYTPIDFGFGWFDVLIKLYPHGRMSSCISKWSKGDMIEWRGPFGTLCYKPNQHKYVVMLAAGTGIAPMLQVIKAIIDNNEDETFIKLFYSCKKASDILMKHCLDEYKQFWNFQSQKHDDTSTLKYGDEVSYNRINEEVLSQNLPQGSTRIVISGTKSFEKDMINYSLKIGFKESDIFKF